MRKSTTAKLALITVLGLSMVLSHPVFADAGGVGQVETFIQSVIRVIAGLAGLVATAFFVVGGYIYIISSGNPEKLAQAKRTIVYSATGLAIVIASFVIASIVTGLATSAFGS